MRPFRCDGRVIDAVVGRVAAPVVRKEEPASPDLRRLLTAAEHLEPGMLRHVAAVIRALASGRRG